MGSELFVAFFFVNKIILMYNEKITYGRIP